MTTNTEANISDSRERSDDLSGTGCDDCEQLLAEFPIVLFRSVSHCCCLSTVIKVAGSSCEAKAAYQDCLACFHSCQEKLSLLP